MSRQKVRFEHEGRQKARFEHAFTCSLSIVSYRPTTHTDLPPRHRPSAYPSQRVVKSRATARERESLSGLRQKKEAADVAEVFER